MSGILFDLLAIVARSSGEFVALPNAVEDFTQAAVRIPDLLLLPMAVGILLVLDAWISLGADASRLRGSATPGRSSRQASRRREAAVVSTL